MEAGRVFISYTHESEAHRARVLELAQRLRTDGIDAWIDRYSAPPLEGWPLWMKHQLEAAQWIIIVCTETYRRRFDQQEEQGKGHGVTWEGRLMRGELYGATSGGHRIVPVIFSTEDKKYIPSELVESPHYCLDIDYAALRRHLSETPEIMPQPLGESPELATPAPGVSMLHVQSSGAWDGLQPDTTKPAQQAVATGTKRVLIVAANRDRDERLALGREIREIANALRGTASRKFDVRILWAATERDFRREFLGVNPHILHFCGHGTPSGPVLEHTEPGDEVLDGEALQRWLKVAIDKNRLEIAVLNFCDSHEMLDALADTAPIVIGPTHSIIDEHAIAFSAVFYMALAAGGTGSFSYYLGKSAVAMGPVLRSSPTRDVVEAYSEPSLSQSQSSGDYGIRCRNEFELPVFGDALCSRSRQQTIAFFASEPEGRDRLPLDRELRGILDVLPSRKFRVEQRWATRAVDFFHTLMGTCPAIVHIAGHGTIDGEFLFEHDRHPKGIAASSNAIAQVLAAFHKNVKCAVLMFSNSYRIAWELNDILDYIVAIHGALLDAESLRFSEVFYQMVGHERSHRTAFEAGLTTLPVTPENAVKFRLYGRHARDPAESVALAPKITTSNGGTEIERRFTERYR